MGKCVSKEKNAKGDQPINRNRREESICTPIQSEGARNIVYSGPLPVFLQKNEVQSHSNNNLKKSTISQKKPNHKRNPSKFSIDFDSLSKLKIEQEMLQRIGKSLHELARCYQNLSKYPNSIEILQLTGEIYMHLGLYQEYNTVMTDLVVSFIATHNLNKKLPVFVDPLEERTVIAISMFKWLKEEKPDQTIEKHQISSFEGFLKVIQKFDSSKFRLNIIESLLDVGHLFRIWLLSPEEALNLYEEAGTLDSTNPEIYFYKGLTYRALGDVELAIENYINGINLKGNYAECYFNLGNIYLEEVKNLKEAEACYLNALFGCENGYEGLISTGKICEMLSEVHLLQENYFKALEVLFQGIGADCLHIESFEKAAKVSDCLGMEKLGRVLEGICKIFNNEILEDMPLQVEEEGVRYKNVLVGSVGELLAFLKKMPEIESLRKSERIEMKRRLSKISQEQISRLEEFYCYLEKI